VRRPLAIALGTLRILAAALMALLGLPLAVAVLLLSLGIPHRSALLGQRAVRVWSAILRRLLGIRLKVVGQLPPPGSFVVSNHVSHFDVLALTGLYPTSLIAKKEILYWPLIGQLAWLVGTVFVDRRDRDKTAAVAAMMGNYLKAGVTVTLFPEGTCGDGLAVLPFKRSLFAVPAELKLPTYPIAIRYPDATAAWQDDTPFAWHLFRLLCKPHQQALIAIGEPIPPGLARRDLAFAAQAKVEELFSSLRP